MTATLGLSVDAPADPDDGDREGPFFVRIRARSKRVIVIGDEALPSDELARLVAGDARIVAGRDALVVDATTAPHRSLRGLLVGGPQRDEFAVVVRVSACVAVEFDIARCILRVEGLRAPLTGRAVASRLDVEMEDGPIDIEVHGGHARVTALRLVGDSLVAVRAGSARLALAGPPVVLWTRGDRVTSTWRGRPRGHRAVDRGITVAGQVAPRDDGGIVLGSPPDAEPTTHAPRLRIDVSCGAAAIDARAISP